MGSTAPMCPWRLPPADLADALRALPKLGFAGVNLTVPHKEAAFDILDSVDDHARRIGAVNTILVQDDGRLFGRNTDATRLRRAPPRERACVDGLIRASPSCWVPGARRGPFA